MYMTGSGWGWLWMILTMAVFWGGVIALILWAFRRPESPGGPSSPPSRILEERFAKGEISASELEEGRRLLGAG